MPQAERVLRGAQADLVALGREMLNKSNLALDAAAASRPGRAASTTGLPLVDPFAIH